MLIYTCLQQIPLHNRHLELHIQTALMYVHMASYLDGTNSHALRLNCFLHNKLICAVRPGYRVWCNIGTSVVFVNQAAILSIPDLDTLPISIIKVYKKFCELKGRNRQHLVRFRCTGDMT